MFDGPLLWFANRGTGLALIVLFTAAVVLGQLSSVGRPGRGVPLFVRQHLHRNVSLLALILLGVHVASAVLDTFVTIHWWEAFVPFLGGYKPLWLGLGAVALDLSLAAAITSMLRTRISHAWWRRLHNLTYVAWSAAMVHSLAIGTDSGAAWTRPIYVGCAVAVGLAWTIRLVAPRAGELAS